MRLTLEQMIADKVLPPVHVALGQLIRRMDFRDESLAGLAAAMVSEQLARGHVCLDLDAVPSIKLTRGGDYDEEPVTYDGWPSADEWLASLKSSPMVEVRTCGDTAERIVRPLVLDPVHHRLYLARYWFYQQRLASNLASRIGMAPLAIDEEQLARDIAALFPDRLNASGRDQCLAAASAVDQRFCVITGGPGTGKTTTVAKLLALRLLNTQGVGTLRVALTAPTGKAAQRLNESMGRVTQGLNVDVSVREQLNSIRAATVHRLLGWTPIPPERGGPFTRQRDFPLEADVVLVDEASMLDVNLMCRLMDAIPTESQVILMGDHDQLASVEAGGVLADLCGGIPADHGGMSGGRRDTMKRRTGLAINGESVRVTSRLADHVVHLRFSHRFDPRGELGRLALCVREGDEDGVVRMLRDSSGGLVHWISDESAARRSSRVVDLAVDGYSHYLGLLGAERTGSVEVLRHLNRFRVLCAHRSGPLGDTTFNRRIRERLANKGFVKSLAAAASYEGCPVMVTSNDPQQELFNGDVGLLVRSAGGSGLDGLFESDGQATGLRRVPAVMLPDWQPCYAMTIHKSQGSEYHQVMVVLPSRPSPILTRELLYTAITRVADELDLVTGERRPGRLYLAGSEDVVRAAVRCRIRRTSGLREAFGLLAEGAA